jgi:hypothetical protein
VVAHNVVHHSKQYPSQITLTVVKRLEGGCETTWRPGRAATARSICPFVTRLLSLNPNRSWRVFVSAWAKSIFLSCWTRLGTTFSLRPSPG